MLRDINSICPSRAEVFTVCRIKTYKKDLNHVPSLVFFTMEQRFLVLKPKTNQRKQTNICSKYNTGEYNIKKLIISQPAFILLRM